MEHTTDVCVFLFQQHFTQLNTVMVIVLVQVVSFTEQLYIQKF
jgi:hypothetical protein